MKRGPQKWTEKVISQFEAEGRGEGELSAYKPWLTVGDVPSRGRVRQVFSEKTGRTHHLLSDNEWRAFLMLERAPDVEDIREQYPLERSLTQEIALSLGIKHPVYPGTTVPAVMTLDFLVTRTRNGQHTLAAFDAKSDEELNDARSMEKLEISREVCQAIGIPHHLLLTSLMPTAKVKNMEWIRGGALRKHEVEPREGFYTEHMAALLHDIVTYPLDVPLREYCERYDNRAGVETGTALRCSRMLMRSRALSIDLSCEDIPSARMGAFQATARKGYRRQVCTA